MTEIIRKIAKEILAAAGRSLNFRTIVELVNGEKGYTEVPMSSLTQLPDTAGIEVYFPHNQGRRGNITFIAKKFMKGKLKIVGDYEKGAAREDVNTSFKHPKFEKHFINQILEFVGDGRKNIWEIVTFMMSRNWKYRGLDVDSVVKDSLKEAGFHIDENNIVTKGTAQRQMGILEDTRLGVQREMPSHLKTALHKHQQELDSKGYVQINFGSEFITESYAISKDYGILHTLQTRQQYPSSGPADMRMNEGMTGYKINQDPETHLYWLATGSSD